MGATLVAALQVYSYYTPEGYSTRQAFLYLIEFNRIAIIIFSAYSPRERMEVVLVLTLPVQPRLEHTTAPLPNHSAAGDKKKEKGKKKSESPKPHTCL